MTRRDIPLGLKLSLAAGWNQTAIDWGMLLDHSSAGSFIACLDGIEAGTVTTVTYQDRLHWIGMVLVAEEFRRRGIGRALLEAAIEAVKGQGVIGLDATPVGKRVYGRLGFQDIYQLGRWLRRPAPIEQLPASLCPSLLTPLIHLVADYDQPVFGADRSGILAVLQNNAPQLSFYTEHEGKLAGYCLGRYGSRCAHIGPVVADTLEIARDLLLSALQSCAQQEVIVDTTFQQPGWNLFLREMGFSEVRPFMRMSLGTFPIPGQHFKQVAIAGPEIG